MERIPAPTRGEEVAWAAGLFEGEGCFYMRWQKVSAHLGSTDRDVLERFQRVVISGEPKVRELAQMFVPWLGKRRLEKAVELLGKDVVLSTFGARKTHCRAGHEYTVNNTEIERRVRADGTEQPIRRCKTCRRLQSRERARRTKGITPDRYRIP